MKMPPPNLQPDFEQQARSFVDGVADQATARRRSRRPMTRHERTARQADGRPVVITGTSTGIGAASAVLLADEGFRVFAGVRRRGGRRGAQSAGPPAT